MAKKRGSIADGVKVAYEVHQALESVQSVTSSKVREFIEGLKEIALMAVTLVAVVGALWLLTHAVTLFKNALM